MARHIKKGDLVEVISGKEKGNQGKILEVLVDKKRVRVEGLNIIKRHLRPNADQATPQGGIVERTGTIHWSNVLPVDPESGKGSRVGRKTLDDGRRVRVAKRSGSVID